MTRGFTNVKKGFANRRQGLMKKANTLHRLTGAHIAVLVEFNGAISSYQSDGHFTNILNNINTKHCFDPDYFETIADRRGRRNGIPQLNGPAQSVPNLSGTTPLTSSTSSTFTTSTTDLPESEGQSPTSLARESIVSGLTTTAQRPDFTSSKRDLSYLSNREFCHPLTPSAYRIRKARELVSKTHRRVQSSYPLAFNFFQVS